MLSLSRRGAVRYSFWSLYRDESVPAQDPKIEILSGTGMCSSSHWSACMVSYLVREMKSAILSPGKSGGNEAGEYESCFYNNGFFHTLFLCELTGITIFSIWQHDVRTRAPAWGVISERSSLTNITRSFQPDTQVPHANRWIARNSIPAGERIIIFLPDPIMSGAGVFMLRWMHFSRQVKMPGDVLFISQVLKWKQMSWHRSGPVSSAQKW